MPLNDVIIVQRGATTLEERIIASVPALVLGFTPTGDIGAVAPSVPPFAGSEAGAVPTSSGGTSNFLRADGIWASPPGVGSVGANVSYTFNSNTTEPPIGSQLRLNNASQTAATKLWVSVMTSDGLDVSLGLAKIKAGHQIYFQDRDSAIKWVKYTVTSDGIAKGGTPATYYEFSISYLSGSADVPFQTIQLQPVSPGTVGVSPGGTTGQVLTKISNADYDVGWTSLVASDIFKSPNGTQFRIQVSDSGNIFAAPV